MKSITSYLVNVEKNVIRREVIEEVVKELEKQKVLLASINSDELDEAYENGLSMAIHVVKEMTT